MQPKIKLNKENGKRLIKLLKTIPEDKFDMQSYRTGSEETHDCDSTGCVIGWATILDTKENLEEFILWNDDINFGKWSLSFFFNLEEDPNVDDMPILWRFLFASKHSPHHKFYNPHPWNGPTTTHAIARLQYIIDDKELPTDWKKQLEDNNLFYMTKTTAQ